MWVLSLTLIGLILASMGYWFVAWACVRAFARNSPRPDTGYRPPVTILKPVKGLDPEAYDNFASFCRQDYPAFEILFGVADAQDPVIGLIQRLQRDFPDCPIRLVVAQSAGANPKSAMLARLTDEAQHEVLVISDSDIRVTPDYLRRVVSDLEDPQVGVVTCLYQSEAPLSLTAKLEALYLDAAFLPGAVVGHRYTRQAFALGATIALRRPDLLRTGGYGAIADYLTDDYLVGNRVAQLGLQVRMADYVVANVIGDTTFGQQWSREVRWARGIRINCPLHYYGMIFTHSVSLAVVLTVLTGLAGPAELASLSLGLLGATVLQRWGLAWLMMGDLGNKRGRSRLPWLPVRDCLSAAIWCIGMVGRHVHWRGTTFDLAGDGRLRQAGSAGAPGPMGPVGPVGRAVRLLDRHLRQRQRIYEFCSDEQCVLRLAVRPAPRDAVLADGTRIHRGDPIGEIHLWNEHLPPIPRGGPDVRWGMIMQRRLRHSFGLLASYVQASPDMRPVKAFHARMALFQADDHDRMVRVGRRMGFSLVESGPPGLLQRWHNFWENFLLLGLLLAFNPRSLKSKPWRRARHEMWSSRDMLVRHHGHPQRHREPDPPLPHALLPLGAS